MEAVKNRNIGNAKITFSVLAIRPAAIGMCDSHISNVLSTSPKGVGGHEFFPD